jgi:hypothetical protein
MTYTGYNEKIVAAVGPVSVVLNMTWKGFIAMIDVMRDPSYPLAQAL